MSIQNKLRKKLAAGELEQVLIELQKITENSSPTSFRNDVRHQAGRFNILKRDKNNGIISDDSYRLESNKIQIALLDLIDKVEFNEPFPTKGEITSTPSIPKQLSKTSSNSQINKIPIANNIPWILGLVFIIGSMVGIIGFPCPTPPQEAIFRLLMAFGGAGIATLLPGLFNIQALGIKATSALGIFTLLYLVSPAKIIENNNLCDEVRFTNVTIFVHGKNGKQDIVSNPTGSIAMILKNERKESFINQNGQATFQNIRIGDTVQLGLSTASPYKIINPDTFYIAEAHGGIYLAIEKITNKDINSITKPPRKGDSTKTLIPPNEPKVKIPTMGVKIDKVIWSKENSSMETNGADYCKKTTKLGCLYTWEAARQACKSLGRNWQLPNVFDWKNLTEVLNNKDVISTLQQLNFEPMLAGISKDGKLERVGSTGYFWTSEARGDNATVYILSKSSNQLIPASFPKSVGISCRCVYKN